MSELDAPLEVTEVAADAPVEAETRVDDRDMVASVKSFFRIIEPTSEETEQLKAIQAYLRGKSDVEALTAIRHIENRLGMPRIGETRLGRVYDYIKAMRMVEEAEDYRDSLLA